MSHQLVIRGGQIVDGTGAPSFEADVAVDHGTITAIGRVEARGAREIDARGQVVSPGFVDIHTHLDAQVGWDPHCTPVSWHGVTTALLGNCGVTFAPCRPQDRGLLAGMMEAVEDIPRDAILSGLPWDWEHYGAYLDSLDRLQPGINLCGLVGHSAVRFYVMGERAVEEQATDAERRMMAQMVGEAIDAGAMGFSTNRLMAHKLPDGRVIPGTTAEHGELIEIAKAVAPRGAFMQAVGADFDTLRAMSDAGGSRLLFSYSTGPGGSDGRATRQALEDFCATRDATAIAQVRSSGLIFGLQSGLPMAMRGAHWKALRALPLEGRLTQLRDPAIRAALVEEARQLGFPSLLGAGIEKVYAMGLDTTPDYAAGDERQLLAMAAQAGEHWAETFLRLSLESAGRALFTLRMFNPDMAGLAHLIGSDHCLPGLGDAGAHVSQVMDAGWSTFVLSHWVRDRGVYSLEEGVRRITSGPARVLGLRDRGVLATGLRADINVFDPSALCELQPEIVHDFPGGAPRYVQRAQGYAATIVNGVVSVEQGTFTGARAGRVLRHTRQRAGATA